MNLTLIIFATAFVLVQAFKDTSPFLLLSSTPSTESIRQFSQEQFKSHAQVLDTTKTFLSGCPSDVYFIITQPAVSAQELSNNAPFIKQAFNTLGQGTKISVRDTVGLGLNDGERLASHLEDKCGTKRASGWKLNDIKEQKKPGSSLVITKIFRGSLEETDKSLYTNLLAGIAKESKYTIILITSPQNSTHSNELQSHSSIQEPLHLELKRELTPRGHNVSGDADLRPLFEKYQFLSPGLFIGILVTLLLLAILSVGIRAISGLEVSYGAFDKEQGPSTVKKQ